MRYATTPKANTAAKTTRQTVSQRGIDRSTLNGSS
jgi:hypothetical protein